MGDEFCDWGFTPYLKQVKKPSENGWFVHGAFNLCNFSATKYSSPVRNILARFKAMVIKAINKQKLLPKAFIFVPDDDIIKQSGIPFDEAKDGGILSDYEIPSGRDTLVGDELQRPTAQEIKN